MALAYPFETNNFSTSYGRTCSQKTALGKTKPVIPPFTTTFATNGVRNIIRRKGGFLLRSVISTGKKHGMVTMAESVKKLLDEGLITEEVAKPVLANYPH